MVVPVLALPRILEYLADFPVSFWVALGWLSVIFALLRITPDTGCVTIGAIIRIYYGRCLPGHVGWSSCPVWTLLRQLSKVPGRYVQLHVVIQLYDPGSTHLHP